MGGFLRGRCRVDELEPSLTHIPCRHVPSDETCASFQPVFARAGPSGALRAASDKPAGRSGGIVPVLQNYCS